MNKLFLQTLLLLASATALAQEAPTCQIHQYEPTDGGIIWGINHTGDWGLVRVGSESAGGTATPKLFDVSTDEAFEVRYGNQLISVSDISADGSIVVGSMGSRPVAYNRSTGKLTTFPLRQKWAYGSLSSITPDGKWAVGSYSGYQGDFGDSDMTGDFYFTPLMVNIETGDTLALPGLPARDMAHLDQHAIIFNDVTPDGRYAIGSMDWYIMQPVSGFVFIYDTQLHTYKVIGFDPDDYADWTPHYSYLHHIEGSTLSPDGHYLAGTAYITRPQEGSEFFNEYGVPYRYDMLTGDFKVFDETESHNIDVGAVANDGTLFGNPDTGSPLRNFRIFYKDRYWISFSQICQQYYGFNFQARTGFEYTGTVLGVSNDTQRIAAFSDPTGQSYIFDFGRPVNEVCASINLLSNYSVSPEPGTSFALISNVEINFGRAVQILGNGGNVHLYKADGTLISNGLSNGGLTMKTGSRNTVVAAFRTRPLEQGTDYYVKIDAGAIAVNGDAELTNGEISILYHGRNDGPVKLLNATPEDGSSLRQIDNASSYILLEFDAEIKTTESAAAYLQRVEDGSILTYMAVASGVEEATRHQLLLTPATTNYLYKGEDYRLVLEAGSVCDFSGNESSLNERIELTYHGTYIREVTSESVMFADDFNNPNTCLTTWLRYEGDHRNPNSMMKAWGFDAANNPWNYTLHDEEGSTDYFAGSHSLYTPAGASDDWMLTPQVAVPLEGKTMLEFDAQSYDPNKHDYLTLRIYENRSVLSYLNTAIMDDVRQQSVLLDSIALTAGANQELTAGEWTHYAYDLSAWAGKDIYIAFVNQNYNQSAVFVDNVIVQREILYTIGFSNRDRVVGQSELSIAGQFTVMIDDAQGPASLTLRDAEGQQISRVAWAEAPAKGTPAAFQFDQPLPLTIGIEVPYTIDVQVGSKADTYSGTIANLAFEPVKRVVLEEMTGTTCVNCPLGIVSIEHCEQAFGDRFIPISIHSYTGDRLGAGFLDYTNFLNIPGAPLARINRLPEVYSPMERQGDEFIYHDGTEQELWYDVVSQELDRLAPADISLKATLSDDQKSIAYAADLRYALTASNQQLSLFVVVLEDGIVSFQQNGFSNMMSETLSDWCNGGPNAQYTVYPYTHNDVVRAAIGQTFSGTIGLYPAHLDGGVTYTAHLTSDVPASVLDVNKLSAVAMLIDTQSGEVINAAKAPVCKDNEQGIEAVTGDDEPQTAVLRSLSGSVIKLNATRSDLGQLPAGIYLLGSRRIMIR